MAKYSEKKRAETLYIDECLTAKEISQKLGVSEKTIGKWVEVGKWKETRLAKQSAPETLVQKYDDIMVALLDKRLYFERLKTTTAEQKEEYRGIIDEMSKLSAMKQKLIGEGKLSLGTHVRCIERFMTALHKSDPKLFVQLLEFNKEYFTQLSQDLK